MKQFELKGLGLEEMSMLEQTAVQGGNFWGTLAKWALGIIAGWAAEKGLDATVEAVTAEDEDIYDATYYGGTLDAAYCYADR